MSADRALASLIRIRDHRAQLALQRVSQCRQALEIARRAERALLHQLTEIQRARTELAQRLVALADQQALGIADIAAVHDRDEWLAEYEQRTREELQRARQAVQGAEQRLSQAVHEYRQLLARRDAAQLRLRDGQRRVDLLAEYRDEVALEGLAAGQRARDAA